MEFRGDNPGAVQYGNFINYYEFHSAEERLSLFPTNVWNSPTEDDLSNKYLVLDIGCNSGNITQLLYPFLKKHTKKEVIILGIDIDSILIQRAQENNKFPNNIVYECINIMTDHSTQFIGHLQSYDKTKFDAVFCLSLTMWIHLNHGDKGLIEFLEKTTNISELLIIEPQPWKCYRTAVNRMKKSKEVFEHFKNLEYRNNVENDIQKILTDKFSCEKIFESIPTKWNRKICFYRKKVLDYNVRLY